MRAAFTVTVACSSDAGREDVAAYIADAVATMHGCMHPADPMTSISAVRVKDDVSGLVVEFHRERLRYDPTAGFEA